MYIYQIMSNNFGYIDIILLGMIAGFIILRLRNILGRKTGHEPKAYPAFSEKKFSVSNNIKSISDIDKSTISNIPTIEELPVQSIICDVIEGDNDIVTIKGIAYSGGGKKIVRVDVSMNGGISWNTAELGDGKEQERNRAWAWTFWEINLNKKNDTMEIISKATDSSYNTQPDNINNIWNIRGILNNSVFKFIL